MAGSPGSVGIRCRRAHLAFQSQKASQEKEVGEQLLVAVSAATHRRSALARIQ